MRKNTLRHIVGACLFSVLVPLSGFAASSDGALIKGIVLSSLDDSSGKILQLADAFSEEQYDWAPMEGVNSVKGAMMHVAGAYYFLGGMLGNPAPEGLNPRELGKDAKTKAEVTEILKAAIAHARATIEGMSEESLAEEIEFFGRKAPRARLMLVLADHSHEHLGQLIAYARVNHVVPPWSK